MQNAYVDTKVLGGLPITVAMTIDRGEPYEWWIVAIAGRDVKKSPAWLYRRLKETGQDNDLRDELYEVAAEFC
jgi:hypothetical protein